MPEEGRAVPRLADPDSVPPGMGFIDLMLADCSTTACEVNIVIGLCVVVSTFEDQTFKCLEDYKLNQSSMSSSPSSYIRRMYFDRYYSYNIPLKMYFVSVSVKNVEICTN